jgi:hypothetical protein
MSWYPRRMPAKTCLVTVTDIRGVLHTARVEADSLFEAAVLGFAALKKDGWAGDAGPATRLEVAVQAPTITHIVTVQQLERWLAGGSISPNEQVRKQKLKELLT